MLKQMDRNNGTIKIYHIYIHRIVRLYPGLIFLLCFYTFILPIFGNGPFYFRTY